MSIAKEIRRTIRLSVRMYFAQLVGAIKGIRAEHLLIQRDAEVGRHEGKI